MNADFSPIVDRIINRSVLLAPNKAVRRWTEEETEFLIRNYSFMTDAEIAEELGRTEWAIHLRRERELDLPAPSKTPDVFTGLHIAKMLGLDIHPVSYWIDCGLIRRYMKTAIPEIRVVKRMDFYIWCMNTDNWIYFDIDKVKDDHLHRLLQLHAQRWGDEWWTTNQVARYWGVTNKDVQRYIKMGWMRGIQSKFLRGGRNPDRKWKYWYVLRSEAMRVKIWSRNNGLSFDLDRKFSAAADVFLLKARNEWKLELIQIARMMKMKYSTVLNRYHQLKGMNDGR